MTKILWIVTMDMCRECGGTGVSEIRRGIPVKCADCKGEGCAEQRIGLREFRHMLYEDAAVEAAEMNAGRFAGVGDAE